MKRDELGATETVIGLILTIGVGLALNTMVDVVDEDVDGCCWGNTECRTGAVVTVELVLLLAFELVLLLELVVTCSEVVNGDLHVDVSCCC